MSMQERARADAERLFQEYHETHRNGGQERDFFAERLTTFAKAEVERERERCAQLLDGCGMPLAAKTIRRALKEQQP